MRIAAQSLIIGASCFCLLRTAVATTASSTCKALKTNMSTSPVKPSPPAYVSGSSSVAFITTPDENAAKKLARSLVENSLAACVNVVPKIMSIYVWEQKIMEDNECMLIVKTRTSRVEDLTKFVRENHSYSVAEVITVPIDQGNPPYMEWLEKTIPDAKANDEK